MTFILDELLVMSVGLIVSKSSAITGLRLIDSCQRVGTNKFDEDKPYPLRFNLMVVVAFSRHVGR